MTGGSTQHCLQPHVLGSESKFLAAVQSSWEINMGPLHLKHVFRPCFIELAMQGRIQWSAHYDRIKQHLECDHTETSRDNTRVVTTSYAGNPLMSLVN